MWVERITSRFAVSPASRVGGDRVQPRLEGAGRRVAALAEEAEEGLLDQVLGQRAVPAEHAVVEAEERALVPAHQLLERRPIARHHRGHELLI
jgi:hypothetical protein